MIEVTDVALRQAAGEGMDAFIGVFTDAYKKEIGGEMTAGTMSLLTGEQHSLLALQILLLVVCGSVMNVAMCLDVNCHNMKMK